MDGRNLGAIKLRQLIGAKFEDAFEAGTHVIKEALNIDAKARWLKWIEQAEGVGEEVDGALVVVAKEVMEAGGDFDDALVEVSEGRVVTLRADFAPDVLERLVAVIETPGVELGDTFGEGVWVDGDGAGGHGDRVNGRGSMVKM